MSYCVKHAENFHTQTCRRCDDESAIAAKDAEIAAMRQEIATGHGQYHRDYAAECDSLLAAKDKVIADLRERCGRLANEVMAWRMADADSSSPDFYTHKAHRREITERMAAVDAHNDLAPAADEAQEKNDG